jgi:hypothetical protein
VLAISLCPGRAVAQDTITITGTFKMYELSGTVGADLGGVYADGYDHWWKLTLSGVTYSHDYFSYGTMSGGHVEKLYTNVHAASFTFEFFGPDAAILNDVVSSQLAGGGFSGGAFLSLMNANYYATGFEDEGVPGTGWDLWLSPSDPAAGVSFATYQEWQSPDSQFASDENGYPLVRSQRLYPDESDIMDYRVGNSGGLISGYDVVDIVVDQQTVPPPPALTAIEDASVVEGDRGATTLFVTVTLSRACTATVTVNFSTANGTALAVKDYAATSGTLTFPPGETSRKIALSIKGDRARETDETFSVSLSNPVGANLGRSRATVTILNDD